MWSGSDGRRTGPTGPSQKYPKVKVGRRISRLISPLTCKAMAAQKFLKGDERWYWAVSVRTKRLVGGFHSARLVAILCVMQPGSQGRGILAGIATGFSPFGSMCQNGVCVCLV